MENNLCRIDTAAAAVFFFLNFLNMKKLLNIDWITGFVWGVGSLTWDRLIIRYHDKELLQQIADTLQTEAKPYHPTKGKTALRFSATHPFAQRLLSLGWTGRMDKDRQYPQGEFDELEFIRGYTHTKATTDLWHYTTRKGERKSSPRLRIWGSYDIVYSIDRFFVRELSTTPKKPYLHRSSTGDCYVVNYQSKREVPIILKTILK
jgi:hypothetical protein